jgi:hypothetical protein
MDRKFKLGDSVNIIGSERSAIVDHIDTGFGVAVYGVRFSDQPASHQWFAAHELVPRARDKLISRWVLAIAGIVDATRRREAAGPPSQGALRQHP